MSNLNPWSWWLAPAAKAVKAERRTIAESNPLRQAEKRGAEMVSASLDYYRATRDAMTEAAFFSIYANPYSHRLVEQKEVQVEPDKGKVNPRELPIVRDTLALAEEGGYVEALARVAFLLKRKGVPLPLSRLELGQELSSDYADYLPEISPHDWRRIRGEQEIIAQYEPERAIETLPGLLQDDSDRERLLTLVTKLMADERIQDASPDDEQVAKLDRLRQMLAKDKGGKVRRPSAGKHA